ncbi:uncharacterized protein LOC143862040 [Tasmannia lanceolata]|uniref:uncharacterized protein LOC143862040 n=1 Tax=Tasmannia lanceolata TaxID=3420 RepID=UPI0040632DEC
MSTRGSKRPLKGYVRDHRRRKRVLDVDLNDTPLGENRAQEAATNPHGDSVVEQISGQGPSPPTLGGGIGTVPIDVEAIDDDEVVISSPRRFFEARNRSRRNPVVTRRNPVATVELDEDSDIHQGRSGAVVEEPATRLTLNSCNNHKRNSSNGTIINCELYINLEGSHSTKRKNDTEPNHEAQSSAPKEPVFSCVICMGPLVEEMSTTCGHIFCKDCIKAAIKAQKKCPTCRRKLTMNSIHRVFLPTTS